MNELLDVTVNESQEPVMSARQLHEFLEIKTAYKDWFPRMVEYGFTEEIDFCSNLSESTGGSAKHSAAQQSNEFVKLKGEPMNDLIKIENGEIRLDSRMIAEHFGKAHSDVLKDIRDETSKLKNSELGAEGIFSLGSYVDKNGQTRPCYEMTEEGALQLAARYDAVARRRLIVLIKRLKENQTDSYMISDPIKRAERWIEEQKEKDQLLLTNQKQQQIIGELKPKADYTDTILNNKGLVTTTQIAKDYGMSGQAFNDLLHNLKIQYKQSGQWLLYQKYHDKGYTHSETINITRSDGGPDVKMNTKWTQKGRLFIYETLKKEGIYPLIERVVKVS